MLESLGSAATNLITAANYDVREHTNILAQHSLAEEFSKAVKDSGLLTEEAVRQISTACTFCLFGPNITPESQKVLKIAHLFANAHLNNDPIVTSQQIQTILELP